MATSKVQKRRAYGRYLVGPKETPAQGIIVFEASVRYLPDALANDPRTLLVKEVFAVLDPQGYVCTPSAGDPTKPGTRGVELFTTDSLAEGGSSWVWTAKPQFRSVEGVQMSDAMDPFSFTVPSSEDSINLAEVAHVPAAPSMSTERAVELTRAAEKTALEAMKVAEGVEARANAGEFEGKPGATGLPGVNAVPASEAVAEYIKAPGNPVNKAATAAFGTHTYMLTSQRFANIDSSGRTDTSAALDAALASLPYGATAVLYGTYKIKTINIDPTKYLTIDASAANLVMDGPFSAIQCVGSFQPQVPVFNIGTETLAVENTQRELTALTTSGTTGWKRGDIIKVVADDIIPAAHVTSDAVAPRVGEFATVYSAVGNKVYLQGDLTEPFTTNVRAARLNPGSVTIVRPSCDVSESRLTDGVAGNMFRFDSLVDPTVIGARLNRLAGMGLSFKSCYGYTVEDLVTLTGVDNTNTGVLSYSVHDSGCVDGRIRGGTLRGGRHGFTDGSTDVEVRSPRTNDYGASMNCLVDGVTVRDMQAACLDTHHNGRGHRFVNCTTFPKAGQNHYSIRGRDHRIVNPTCWGGSSIAYVQTQLTGAWSRGETYGIELVNPRSYGTHRVVTANIRTAVQHPFYGVRDGARTLTIVGGYHEGLRRAGLIINANVAWRGHADIVLGSLAEGAFWETQNAALQIDDTEVDATRIVQISPFGTQRVLFGNDSPAVTQGSDIQIKRIKVTASDAYRAAAAVPFEVLAQTRRIIIDDLVFDPAFAALNPLAIPDAITQQSVRWRVSSDSSVGLLGTRSSGAVIFLDNALAGSLARLFRAPDPILLLQAGITDSTPRTLAPLPKGQFVGQILKIVLTSAGAPLTLANGIASNMGLTGSANKALSAANDQVSLWWTGTIWRQERNLA